LVNESLLTTQLFLIGLTDRTTQPQFTFAEFIDAGFDHLNRWGSACALTTQLAFAKLVDASFYNLAPIVAARITAVVQDTLGKLLIFFRQRLTGRAALATTLLQFIVGTAITVESNNQTLRNTNQILVWFIPLMKKTTNTARIESTKTEDISSDIIHY